MDVQTEGKFALFYDFFLDGALKPIRLKNLEIISKYHCQKIIDLGCGTGSQCRILSKHGFEVVGIDSSEKMLKVAKKKNIYKTTFMRGDITQNLLPHETFDCVIITLVLHTNNRKTIKRILEEAKKVTKKMVSLLSRIMGMEYILKERSQHCSYDLLNLLLIHHIVHTISNS
jgi:ubiquinone/menaquinone biosynthesis C-methylase UbiE